MERRRPQKCNYNYFRKLTEITVKGVLEWDDLWIVFWWMKNNSKHSASQRKRIAKHYKSLIRGS